MFITFPLKTRVGVSPQYCIYLLDEVNKFFIYRAFSSNKLFVELLISPTQVRGMGSSTQLEVRL